MVRWWNQHSSTPLSGWVGPPSASGMTWWISHHAAGTEQPGIRHPPSRRVIARRWCGVKQRSGEPSSMMRPSSSKVDGLGAAGADHVPGGAERDRDLDAVGVRDAAAGGEVGRPDADEHRGRGTADRGVLAGAGGGVDRGGEHVVALLVGGAVSRRTAAKPARSSSVWKPRPGAGREVRVEEPGEFRRDLGHEVAGDRHESVAGPTEADPATSHRPLVVGFAAVLVEERGPRLRLHAQLVGGAPHRCAVAAAGRLGDERLLGGRERGRVGDRCGRGRVRG